MQNTCLHCSSDTPDRGELLVVGEIAPVSVHGRCLLELLKVVLGDVTCRFRDAEEELPPPDVEDPQLDEQVALYMASAINDLGRDDDFVASARAGIPWRAVQESIKEMLPPDYDYANGIAFTTLPTLFDANFGQQGYGWSTHQRPSKSAPGSVTTWVQATDPARWHDRPAAG